jgi:Type II secretion system (T2SS), protein E, N-terminal domain
VSGTAPSARAVKAPPGVTPPGSGARSGFLSDVIVELGFASREAVEKAVRAARSPGTTVARVLLEMGAISEEQLARATAERNGIDYVDLDGFRVDPAAANLIEPDAARRCQAVPVARLGGGVLVAIADPADALGLNQIAALTKAELRPAVASRPALEALLEALPLEEAPESDTAIPDELPWVDERPAEEAAGPESPAAPPPAAAPLAEPSRLRDELEMLKAQLAGAEAKLTGSAPPADASQVEELRSRAAADASQVEQLRARLAAAEAELEEARLRLREAKEVGAELEALREQAERERELWAITERELRASLAEEERRRAELEERLSEVEKAAFAAERAFEELRVAQGRMRGALRELAGQDSPPPTAAGSSGTAARTP